MATKSFRKYMDTSKYPRDNRPPYITLEGLCRVARYFRETARAERVFMREGIMGIIENPQYLRGFVKMEQFRDEIDERIFDGLCLRRIDERTFALARCFPHASFKHFYLESVISDYRRRNVLQDLLTVDLMVKDVRGDGLLEGEVSRVAEALWEALQSGSAKGCPGCGPNGYYCSCM